MLNVSVEKSKKPSRCPTLSDRNGLCKTIYDENGDLYSGLWKDGIKHGFGTQKWTKEKTSYVGSFENGMRHGEGVLYRTNTMSEFVYNGEWKKDKRHGKGIHVYDDGGRYEGAWDKNKRNGFGQMDYSDDSTYIGHWKKDQRSDFGKMWYANGEIYEGSWKNDKRHGEGILITKKQNKYEGFWENDQKHGEGKYRINENGLEFTGLWINDNFCCGTLEVKNSDAPFPMKLEIPKWTLRNPQEVIENAKKYYKEKKSIRIARNVI